MNFSFNSFKETFQNHHVNLLKRFHKSSFLALTIKNEINKYLLRVFIHFTRNSLFEKMNFEKLSLVFLIENISKKKIKLTKWQIFNNIHQFSKKQFLFSSKTLRNFSNFLRDFNRMQQIRKIQSFFAIKNYINMKRTIKKLNIIDLNPINHEIPMKIQIDKENFNPNSSISSGYQLSELNDWMYMINILKI